MKEIFEEYIENSIGNMQGDYIELISGDVHKKLGGYPSKNHRMPICCDVMYHFMKNNDEVICSPAKGKGATLKIRYYKKNHITEVLKCHNT